MVYSPDGDSDKDGFITQHRICSVNDRGWAKLDADREASSINQAKKLAAAKAFRDVWQVSDLDDLIDGLEADQSEGRS